MQHKIAFGASVQVNVPFLMLEERYLETFKRQRLNPEIGLNAQCLEEISPARMQALAAQLQGEGLKITIHGPFLDLSAGSPDPRIREVTRLRLEQLLRVVPVFKPTAVVCHPGYDKRRYNAWRREWLQNSVALWSWMAARLRDLGTVLMLENVYEDTPEEMEELLRPLQEMGVGFCLDTGHQAAFGNKRLLHWARMLSPYLRQLHLHDNHGTADEHLALGSGGIDFEGLFGLLHEKLPVQPLVTLEPHDEADLWPSLDFLNKYWPWRVAACNRD